MSDAEFTPRLREIWQDIADTDGIDYYDALRRELRRRFKEAHGREAQSFEEVEEWGWATARPN